MICFKNIFDKKYFRKKIFSLESLDQMLWNGFKKRQIFILFLNFSFYWSMTFSKLILSVAALMGKKAWHGPGRRREVLWFFHWNWNIVLGEVMWFYTEERFFDFLQIPRFYLSVHFVELVNVHGEVHYVLQVKQNPCCPSPPPPSWPGRACQ